MGWKQGRMSRRHKQVEELAAPATQRQQIAPNDPRSRCPEAAGSTTSTFHHRFGRSVVHQATEGGIMPLKANVGLSRKVADNNYGSRGASINIELELDSSLIGEPAKFQEKIRQVYGLARAALNDELNGNGQSNDATNESGNGNTPQNGSANGTNGQRPRPATQSQVKALHAIARN